MGRRLGNSRCGWRAEVEGEPTKEELKLTTAQQAGCAAAGRPYGVISLLYK